MNTDNTDYLENLNRLIHQKERAIAIVLADQSASEAKFTGTQREVLRKLQDITRSSELLESPELLPYIPLLGALERNDTNQAKSALNLIAAEGKQNSILFQFVPSYASVIVFICLGILSFQAIFVVPSFERMLSEFGMRLPAVTQFTFGINRFIRNYFHFIAIACIALYVLSAMAKHSSGHLLNALSRIPIVGELFSGNEFSLEQASKHALITAELLEQKVPLNLALLIGAGKKIHMSQTKNASSAKLIHLHLPSSVVWLVRQSPLTHRDVNYLRDLSQLYADRLMLSGESMKGAPLMQTSLLIAGVFVAITVLSVFMPLVSLVTALA